MFNSFANNNSKENFTTKTYAFLRVKIRVECLTLHSKNNIEAISSSFDG